MTQTNKDQAPHSPETRDNAPYDLAFDGKNHIIMTKNGKVIASFDEEQDLNASYFHMAVNNHDKLVEALKDVSNFLELLNGASQSWDDYEKDVKNVYNKINQALKETGE